MTIFTHSVQTLLSMVNAIQTNTKRENMHLGPGFDCTDDAILLSDWSPYSQGTSHDVLQTDKLDDYSVSYHR